MKLSIITIVLNDKQNIERTINSVLSQNTELEYIIIDGGSTDGTLEIIKKYEDNIDILVSEKDSGIYSAMNKGVALANGQWICFMNSGDIFYSSNAINNLFNNIDANAYDILYGDHEVRYSHKTRIAKADRDIDNIWKGMVFSHQSSFVRKTLLKKYIFNELNKITADYEFFYTLYKAKKKFLYVPTIIASVGSGGFSDTKRIESIMGRWGIIDKNLKVNLYYLRLVVIELIKIPIKRFLHGK